MIFGALLDRWWWPRRRAAGRTAPAPPAEPVAVEVSEAPPVAPWRLVQRRALIDPGGAIRGWDLALLPEAVEREQHSAAPQALRAAHRHALAQAARIIGHSGREALVAAPVAALRDPEFLAVLPAGTIVRPARQAELSDAELHRIAVEAGRQRLRLAAERVSGAIPLLDAAPYDDPPALRAAFALRPARDAGGIAINLRSIDDVADAMRAGFRWCCGEHTRVTRGPRKAEAPPAAMQVASILAAVLAGAPPQAIAQSIKLDVTISYRLLRTVNSAAFALTRRADSIDIAIALLGTRELCRWLAALLLHSDPGTPAAAAVQESALARARLCEMLARERGSEPPETLFVTGAFSLLDVLLDVPLEVPLAHAGLPAPAVEALIGHGGPWWPLLEAALAAEGRGAASLDETAARLGVALDRLAALIDEARSWAQQAATALGKPPDTTH